MAERALYKHGPHVCDDPCKERIVLSTEVIYVKCTTSAVCNFANSTMRWCWAKRCISRCTANFRIQDVGKWHGFHMRIKDTSAYTHMSGHQLTADGHRFRDNRPDEPAPHPP